MNRRVVLALGAAVAAALASPPAAAGQTAAPPLSQRPNALSVSPILAIPFTYVTVEYERAVLPAFSLAPFFSHFAPENDWSYTTFEVRGRFYPNEAAPEGFSVGLAAGVTRVEEEITECCFPDPRRAELSETNPTLQVTIDYNFLLGRTDRFLIGAGFGAKRIFGDDDRFQDVNFVYPTARLQVGFVF